MLNSIDDISEVRSTLLSLLNTNGTLAGISAALAGLLNVNATPSGVGTLIDDVLLISALGFVVVCYLIFFALRYLHAQRLRTLSSIIETLFLGSLSLLLVAGFLTVYAVV